MKDSRLYFRSMMNFNKKMFPALLTCAIFISFTNTVSSQQCTTPNGTPGSCMDYRNCPTIFDILNRPTILPNSTIFLINSFCRPASNITRVCCEIKLPADRRRCTNPKLQNGFCMGINQCSTFGNIVDQEIFPEHAIFAMQSSCGPSQKSSIFSKNPEVCCVERTRGIDSSNRAGEKNLTIVNNATKTSVENKTVLGVGKDNCENSIAMSGKCIGIKECPALLSLIQDKDSFEKKADFVRQSVCGGKSGKYNYNICCPSFNFLQHESMALLPDKDTCGTISSPKVYGGTTADLGEFPWMVLLRYSEIKNDVTDYEEEREAEGIFGCGGVLISDRYVLTAAHCVTTIPESFNLTLKDIRLGEYDITNTRDCIEVGPKSPPFCSDDVVDVPTEEVVVHEQYNVNKRKPWNDIALLRLGRRIEYTEFIKPICLPSTPSLLLEEYVGNKLHIAGWGSVDRRRRGNILQKLQVPVRSNAWCIKRYKEMNLMTMKQICAGGEEGKDSCNGDSGGPLMVYAVDEEGNVNWYAAGIVSFGPSKCGQKGIPAVYTRVNSYIDWIVSNMRP